MAVSRLLFGNPAVKKYFYNLSGFNRYGLFHDDLVYENEDVKEALRRLPQNIKDERVFRIQRASQLSISHTILPKEEWTKFEEDIRYLQPYLDEVRKEKAERETWVATH